MRDPTASSCLYVVKTHDGTQRVAPIENIDLQGKEFPIPRAMILPRRLQVSSGLWW
jgi:hypothetical protein